MTTTPGPRTSTLRTSLVQNLTSFREEAEAVSIVAEFEDRIRAEARADVDGLVALHPAAIALAVWPSVTVDMDTPVGREVVRKGEVIKQRLLALLAGDKAEAPE